MDKELEAMVRLDLRDFLETQEGWHFDAAESTRDSFKMRLGSHVLVVRQRDDGVWGYFNPQDPDDNGTIVQYLQRRRSGFTLGHVKHHLRPHVKARLGPIVPGLPSPRVRPPRDLSRVVERWQSLGKPVVGLPSYLAARGIVAAMVAAYASALRVDRRGNVLFAHTNDAGQLVGYEIAGPELHSFSKGGVRLLCRLGPLDGPEPAKIALTESGLDALSLAQLVGRRDTLFLSTGGAVSAHTLRQVEGLAAKFPAAEILLGFDNDSEGHAFAARVEQTLGDRENVRRVTPKAGKDWNDALRLRLAANGCVLPTPQLGG